MTPAPNKLSPMEGYRSRASSGSQTVPEISRAKSGADVCLSRVLPLNAAPWKALPHTQETTAGLMMLILFD